MLTLMLTTSTKLASLSLFENDKMLVNINVNVKKTHSTNFIDELDSLFKFSNNKIENVKNVLISIGPGSFTGIRIALATIKGIFSLSNDVKFYKINELDALGYQGYSILKKDILAVIDSNKEKIYFGRYKNGKRVGNLEIGKLDDAINISKKEKYIIYGDAVINYRNKLKENNVDIDLKDHFLIVNASSFYQMYLDNLLTEVDIYNLIPEYLELSQAEKERR